jgi:hypothetical protein
MWMASNEDIGNHDLNLTVVREQDFELTHARFLRIYLAVYFTKAVDDIAYVFDNFTAMILLFYRDRTPPANRFEKLSLGDMSMRLQCKL